MYYITTIELLQKNPSKRMNIKEALEDILTNGFKIWYNSELKEKIENADIQ